MQHKISVRPALLWKIPESFGIEHIKTVGVEYLELIPQKIPNFSRNMMQDEETQFKVGSFVFDIVTDDPNSY